MTGYDVQHYVVMTSLLRPFDHANAAPTPSFSAVVLAADAERAISEAEQRGHDEAMDMDPVRRREAYLHGQRDMLAKADTLRPMIEEQFRMAYQLGACDPANCLLCDCNMDDEGRGQLSSMAASQTTAVLAALRELGGSDE